MNLFYIEESDFTLTVSYDLKINIEALCDDDIKALAKLIVKKHTFKDVFYLSPKVEKLSKEILHYASEESEDYMILDDTLKTGDSIIHEQVRLSKIHNIGSGSFFGVVIFSKMDETPDWIYPLFQM